MKKAPEEFRLRHGPMGSDPLFGNNGFFIIPHYRINNYEIRCQVSDGSGWEHVSITIGQERPQKNATRSPTWEEMCWVKDLFWNPEECVIQFHPPASEYVSCHPHCLHLWKPIGVELPLPNSLMVGPSEYIKKIPNPKTGD